MSFELEPAEDAATNLRRIVVERASLALDELAERSSRGEAGRIHSARKRFKEIRAVLRLGRGALGERLFRRENRAYRDAARPLSAVRDARVLIDALDSLVAHFDDYLKTRAFAPVRKLLERRARVSRREIVVEQGALATVRQTVTKARRRAEHWRLEAFDFSVFVDGLATAYRDGREAMAGALAEADDEALHEWRKQVKYLRHQAEVLRPIWSAGMGALVAEAKDLADFLGDDHDLAVLRVLIRGELREDVPGRERKALRGLADERRATLQKHAAASGLRLYAEKPKAFTRRMREYMGAWAPGGGSLTSADRARATSPTPRSCDRRRSCRRGRSARR